MRLYLLLATIGVGPLFLLALLHLAPAPILLVGLLLAVVLYPVSGVIARPLEELTGLAHRIKSGEMGARAVLRPETEWAFVATVLSNLAEQHDALNRSLEQQVAARTAALSRTADQFRAVGQVGQQVASVLEPEALLHFVTRVMRGTFGYDLVAVLQKHGDHLVLTACAARGVEEPPLGRVLPLSASSSGATSLVRALNGEGVVESTATPLLADLIPEAEMAIPIRVGERVLGLLVVQSLSPDPFDSEDLFTVRTIAGQVAVALENARLFEAERQLRDLAITDERNRMAREIHDTLAQGFMGIIMQLRAMQTSATPEQAAYHQGAAEELARESLQEARRSVWNLRPQTLEGRGLAGALAEEVAGLERRAALHGRFEVEGEVDQLPAAVESALLRIAQEALHNAVKHAKAGLLAVRLVRKPSVVELTVEDDGVGFDPDEVAPRRVDGGGFGGGSSGGGFGLGAMTDRARLLGGELAIHAAPGAGCRVVARIPLKERA